MEKEQLRKLIHDAFAAMEDESNKEALYEIMNEYAPFVFLRKDVCFAFGSGVNVCAMVGKACIRDKNLHTAIRVAMRAIEECEKEKTAPTVQANA